jgi:hypothetical protein
MKTLRFLAIAFGVCALASAQNINVQKASTTNNITGNLTIGSGKTLLGDTGSLTNFATIGIGTGSTVPATNLQVIDTATTTPRGITNDQYNNGTNGAQMNWRKARGTFATPTTVVTGDLLGRAIFWGYDGTGFIESGNLRFTSLGTIGTNRMASVFDVYVSTDAAPSVLTQTASFSGTAGITLTAIGTNQNITLTPSGTGSVVITKSTQVTTTADAVLKVSATANQSNQYLAVFSGRTTSPKTFEIFQGGTSVQIGSTTDTVDIYATNTQNMRLVGSHLLLGGLTTDGTGVLQFPAAITSAGGITFGTDFNFYRTGTAAVTGFGNTNDTTFGLLSGNANKYAQFTIGRASQDVAYGVAAAANNFFTGTAAGDFAIQTNNGQSIFFGKSGSAATLILDNSQNATFAGRAIGASFGSATAAAVAVRYNSTSSITVNSATSTGLQFNNYGAGALSTDASGNITATSDGRLKNIVGAFARGLTSIRNLHPATYRWKKESGMDTEHDYTGFVAQDVQAAIPEAIGKTPDGFLTFSDRPVLAAAVNAINELDGKTVSKTEIRIFEFIALAALVLAIRANVRKNQP